MDDFRSDDLDGYLRPVRDDEVASNHRVWMNEQIAETLAKKERGEMNYAPLDQVRRAFKLDAS
ncbi:hypothetical protein E3C22_02920 [Jiella endophytica]|uniref:Uncharacterized protein n=1 Tax=Jiella endophytica TaxID=2558362 RepID=A0A4Y8RU17_9HYPH|nr:hypothetical protein [Jiella endophytica]TFF27428.1 hypothetical protein E3C22_02920 [Jiella endophytica]